MTFFFYVLREYLRYVLGTVVLCIFLFILFDFMHKSTRYFPQNQAEGADIALFYFYQLPFQVVQALPIAALLGSVIAMVVMSRGNEVTVMRSAGMGPWRISMPLAVGGIGLSLISLIVGEYVIPQSSRKMHYVREVEIEKQSRRSIAEGARWLRDRDRLFNFGDFHPESLSLTDITLIRLGAGFRPTSTITAESATYSPLQGNWKLFGVKTYAYGVDGTLNSLTESESTLAFLPVDPFKLQNERRPPGEMGSRELQSVIDAGELSGKDVLDEKIALQLKWSYPFAAFLVSLLGIRFGYRSERSNETVRKVLLAFLTGISYWFVLSAGRALASRGDIPPVVGAWSANAAMILLIAYQSWSLRRA